MANPTETPEHRRRRTLPRETVFTASMAGREVQRRFLIQKRTAFTLAILLGLSAMWILALQTESLRALLRWPFFLAAGCCFLLSAAVRRRPVNSRDLKKHGGRWLQAAAFYLAFITLGGGIGTLSPPGNGLLNPTVLVGLTALGVTMNTVIFRKERTRLTEFLLGGPWLAAAGVIVFFLPAGEWVLLASGIAAVLLMLMLILSADATLQIFQPREYLFAAADVIPIFFLLAWRGWSGQN
jgi:hypothetical protein